MALMVATTRGRGRRSPSRRLAAVLLPTVGWALPLAGCTDEPDRPEPGRPQVALEIELVKGVADLGPEARDELQTAIGDVLSSYVVAGFLGDYPRDDFVRSLDSFTPDAARSAAEDLDLLTGADFAAADDVVATSLVARISAFAPEGQAEGASAQVAFDFEVTDDGEASEVTLEGRLMLTPENDAWRIFGYDVTLDEVPAEGPGDGVGDSGASS